MLGLQSLPVLPAIKRTEIKLIKRQGLPESQSDGVVGCITRNRDIVSSSNNGLTILPNYLLLAVLPFGSGATIEVDFVLNIDAFNFPRVAFGEPEVRSLELISILYELFEDAVLVSDSVAPCRVIQCCHRIQKAGSEPPETTISQASIRLFFSQSFVGVSQIFERLLEIGLKIEVDESILEASTNEKLKGQVVDFLLS